MNRLIHIIILLMAFLPAFFMPTKVVVCLTNGIGHKCCAGSASNLSPCSSTTSATPAAQECCCSSKVSEESLSCCASGEASDDKEGEGGDCIASGCKCCISIDNPRDDLEKSEYTVDLKLPPLGPGVAVESSFEVDTQAVQIVKVSLPDPPRIRPLLI